MVKKDNCLPLKQLYYLAKLHFPTRYWIFFFHLVNHFITATHGAGGLGYHFEKAISQNLVNFVYFRALCLFYSARRRSETCVFLL